jgi:hypothetical protein
MVYCRQCQQKVTDCSHFVEPIAVKPTAVFDEKVESLAYEPAQRTLQIRFKSGQVWQLFAVPPGIYQELSASTISSFLKFIAQRYQSAPVRTVFPTIAVPKTLPCSHCKAEMRERHRRESAFGKLVRVFWTCTGCGRSEWRQYGQ